MSLAIVLAAVAGALAGAGVCELAAGSAAARATRAGRSRRPHAGVRVLAQLGRSARMRPAAGLAARLEGAGLDVPVADVMALKAGAALLAFALAVPLATVLPGRLGLLACALAPAGAFFGPDGWLRRRTRERVRAVEDELADVLDLLRVAVAAGLAPGRALAEVGRRHPGVLAGELRRAAERMGLGVGQAEALAGLERRCPAPPLRPLLAALRRAAAQGAPLGETLAAQALEARAQRARRTSEAAARAAPKIQLVVALLLVPAVLMLVAAALAPAVLGR